MARGVSFRRARFPFNAPPAALVLVAATYAESTWVRLTFDRPIDIGGFVGAAIVVNDGDLSATRWQGIAPATLIGPASVEIQLAEIEPIGAGDVRLTASAGNGIVAVDDGGTWGGVSALSLPFP